MANKFYAQKDHLGFPIPGTMMSAAAKVPKDSIEIPASNVAAAEGQAVVSHPDKLRYFVRKDNKGNIVPNTLIVSYKQPKGSVYEFKLVKAV